jgi:hypothetical protein
MRNPSSVKKLYTLLLLKLKVMRDASLESDARRFGCKCESTAIPRKITLYSLSDTGSYLHLFCSNITVRIQEFAIYVISRRIVELKGMRTPMFSGCVVDVENVTSSFINSTVLRFVRILFFAL